MPDARLLTRLDYYEAQEIATTGAKVLHPRAIRPCRNSGVPMAILDTERPQLPGTSIDGDAEPVPGVKAISRRNGIVLVSMEGISMWQQAVSYTHLDVYKRQASRSASHAASVALAAPEAALSLIHI